MKLFGESSKTTIAGYILAIFIAVQPILLEDINFDSRSDWFRYALRLIGAALVAIVGRQAADSTQVKEVKAEVKDNTSSIEKHEETIQTLTPAKKTVVKRPASKTSRK